MDDLISRQAAIDAIGSVPDHNDGMVWEALSHAQRDVALLPSVEPERNAGHWEWDQRTGEYVCSECGCNPIYERTTPDVSEIDKYRFCRWCGAKMESKVSTKEVIDEFIKRELKGDTDGQS